MPVPRDHFLLSLQHTSSCPSLYWLSCITSLPFVCQFLLSYIFYILCILYCAFCIVFLNISDVLNTALPCLYRLLQCRVAATPKSTRISHWDPKEQVGLRKCILAIIHKISGMHAPPRPGGMFANCGRARYNGARMCKAMGRACAK